MRRGIGLLSAPVNFGRRRHRRWWRRETAAAPGSFQNVERSRRRRHFDWLLLLRGRRKRRHRKFSPHSYPPISESQRAQKSRLTCPSLATLGNFVAFTCGNTRLLLIADLWPSLTDKNQQGLSCSLRFAVGDRGERRARVGGHRRRR